MNTQMIELMIRDFLDLDKQKQDEIIDFLLIRLTKLSCLTDEIITIILQLCQLLKLSKLDHVFVILTLFRFKQVLAYNLRYLCSSIDIINDIIMECIILNIETENDFKILILQCMSMSWSSFRQNVCLHCFEINFFEEHVYTLAVPERQRLINIVGEKYHELLNIVNRKKYTGTNWIFQLERLQERFDPKREITGNHYISQLPIRLLTGAFLVFCILNNITLQNYDLGNNYRITCVDKNEFDITFYIYPRYTIIECLLIQGSDVTFQNFISFLKPYENIPFSLCISYTPELLRSLEFPFEVFCQKSSLQDIKKNGLKIFEILQLFISSVRLKTLNCFVVPIIFLFIGSDFEKIDFMNTLFDINKRIMIQ
jgi:hypothetical protein